MGVSTSSDQNSQGRLSLATSRRNLLAGSRLLFGAAAALALGVNSGKALASNAGGVPSCAASGGKSNAPACNHCFLSGTLIETADGPVAVEDLAIGDRVVNASGEAKPVKWIGKRQLERASNPGAAPVKIAKYAIDGRAPCNDLYLSPGHAIYTDGVLIPAVNLVNGITIIAEAKPELSSITYYHVEFETHEVIYAEGLAVESFLAQNVIGFDNSDEYLKLYGPRTQPMAPFAPVLSYYGRKRRLASHIRSVVAPIYDFRKPFDRIRDRIADQAVLAKAA